MNQQRLRRAKETCPSPDMYVGQQYVSELLAHYRTDAQPKTGYSPFTEDALKLLLTHLQRRTPRDVNKRCRNVLLRAFETGNGAEITVDFVRKMSLEELDREMG